MAELNPELNDRFKLGDTEIFMSISRLHRICNLLGNADNVALLLIDTGIQMQTLIALLTTYKKSGEIDTQPNPDSIEFSHSELLALLSWTAEHCYSFFIRGLTSVSSITSKMENLQAKLSTATPNGSQA